jgi:DNA-binding PadR family transcriptional regulator
MSLQHAILGVLEARPMTGYELTRFFESTARWVWSAPQSQIYPLLHRLEAEGLIRGENQLRGQKLRRTLYSLTEAGLTDLRHWLVEPHDEPPVRDPLLLQALFLDTVDPPDAERVLSAHLRALEAGIEGWTVHRNRLLARDTPLLRERLASRNPADHARIAALKAHVFDYLIDSAELRIAWIRRALAIVAGETPRGAHESTSATKEMGRSTISSTDIEGSVRIQ